MDFQVLDDLAAVQETGYFSLATQKPHISQPALSKRIKDLEYWAGFSLVDRRSVRGWCQSMGYWPHHQSYAPKPQTGQTA
jgi:hypothetical protein